MRGSTCVNGKFSSIAPRPDRKPATPVAGTAARAMPAMPAPISAKRMPRTPNARANGRGARQAPMLLHWPAAVYAMRWKMHRAGIQTDDVPA